MVILIINMGVTAYILGNGRNSSPKRIRQSWTSATIRALCNDSCEETIFRQNKSENQRPHLA